ncbi:MAG: hypothetical protein K6D56_04855 [Clostridia bacterium]|nr:hypothetical protein [Clostridia bacterium]
MNKKRNYMIIFLAAGGFLAYSIGAAFATGQEMLQYFGAFGPAGLAGCVLTLILFLILLLGINRDSARTGLMTEDDMFKLYAGKYLGQVYIWFTRLFLALLVIVMISGAGATFEQTYGIPSLGGRIILGVICFVTVLFGLKGIIDIIGRIGPLIIALVFIVCLYNIFNGENTWAEGVEFLKNTDLGRASNSWAMASFLYCNACLLLQFPFLVALNRNYPGEGKSVLRGLAIGITSFMITAGFTVVAIVKNATVLEGVQVPFLTMATRIGAGFGIFYSITIFLGIYTTTTPLIWSTIKVIAPEKTPVYYISAAVLVVVSIFLGNVIPFSTMLGTAMNIAGYLAILLVACMVVYWVRLKTGKLPDPDKAVTEKTE